MLTALGRFGHIESHLNQDEEFHSFILLKKRSLLSFVYIKVLREIR